MNFEINETSPIEIPESPIYSSCAITRPYLHVRVSMLYIHLFMYTYIDFMGKMTPADLLLRASDRKWMVS